MGSLQSAKNFNAFILVFSSDVRAQLSLKALA
jgi:hypothetical protein